MLRLASMSALLLLVGGCGGASRQYAAQPVAVSTASGGYGGGSYAGDEAEWRSAAGPSPERQLQSGLPTRTGPRLAQADPPEGAEPTASDAANVPLLIYQAQLGLAVHQVSAKQDRVEAIAREAGGFLASRTDDTIVVRVPAREFDAVMAEVQALGDVLTRRIEVQDVTEEFRDAETRIQTLEAMRRRVEQLLEQANDVQAALAVEQHLERITVELERLRGRLRFLADRVAFSTITVRFQERAETTEPQFELPFPWLRQLGLQRLLRL